MVRKNIVNCPECGHPMSNWNVLISGAKPQIQKEFRVYDLRAHAPFVKMAYDRLRLLPQTIRSNRILAQRYSRRR